MNKYLRQCWYLNEAKQIIYIFLEVPYVEADSEEEALADLLEKYIETENIVCGVIDV